MDRPVNAALMPVIPLQAPVKTEEFTCTFEKLPLKPREVWESRVTQLSRATKKHVRPRLKALSGRGRVGLEAVRIDCEVLTSRLGFYPSTNGTLSFQMLNITAIILQLNCLWNPCEHRAKPRQGGRLGTGGAS